ncbi:hypothetical protein QAD02_000046 [Eretmocerus hayati]|uniref:Uncharacterized protein n=1 Tax=Eretmocerus hayati TaxID=131215 RepID=A0ACC2NEV0_9HYME|nr:hypothetical protein QAD02_000046 [Eretmocerus hayati]
MDEMRGDIDDLMELEAGRAEAPVISTKRPASPGHLGPRRRVTSVQQPLPGPSTSQVDADVPMLVSSVERPLAASTPAISDPKSVTVNAALAFCDEIDDILNDTTSAVNVNVLSVQSASFSFSPASVIAAMPATLDLHDIVNSLPGIYQDVAVPVPRPGISEQREMPLLDESNKEESVQRDVPLLDDTNHEEEPHGEVVNSPPQARGPYTMEFIVEPEVSTQRPIVIKIQRAVPAPEQRDVAAASSSTQVCPVGNFCQL